MVAMSRRLHQRDALVGVGVRGVLRLSQQERAEIIVTTSRRFSQRDAVVCVGVRGVSRLSQQERAQIIVAVSRRLHQHDALVGVSLRCRGAQQQFAQHNLSMSTTVLEHIVRVARAPVALLQKGLGDVFSANITYVLHKMY
jgi:hypothetical protein